MPQINKHFYHVSPKIIVLRTYPILSNPKFLYFKYSPHDAGLPAPNSSPPGLFRRPTNPRKKSAPHYARPNFMRCSTCSFFKLTPSYRSFLKYAPLPPESFCLLCRL